ncbi:hypothetical protein [Sphingopyxis sp. GC21]|uniref:hypothetical protein n=1 Tax=Sphingopyxis sp. GC21 TaxID=2933562 RepID=UPI0021E4EA3E|nr:hypothetical protein [Sphingopyxis sp. GC21]
MRLMISAFSLLAASIVITCVIASGMERIPEITRDLPATYAEGGPIFDARLKARFPLGTAENAIIEELERQGFSIKEGPHGRFATFVEKKLIVSNIWNVGWEAENGAVSKIWGVYGGRGP